MDRIARAIRELAAALDAAECTASLHLRGRRHGDEVNPWPYVPRAALPALATALGIQVRTMIEPRLVSESVMERIGVIDLYASCGTRQPTTAERRAEMERMAADLAIETGEVIQ